MGTTPIKWDGPAGDRVDGAEDGLTLIEWVRGKRSAGHTVDQIARYVGCTDGAIFAALMRYPAAGEKDDAEAEAGAGTDEPRVETRVSEAEGPSVPRTLRVLRDATETEDGAAPVEVELGDAAVERLVDDVVGAREPQDLLSVDIMADLQRIPFSRTEELQCALAFLRFNHAEAEYLLFRAGYSNCLHDARVQNASAVGVV